MENLEAQLIGVTTNIQLTKKDPVIFHNLRGYDVKIDVMPKWARKIHSIFFKQKLSIY